MTAAELRTAISTAISTALEISASATAGEYSSLATLEADINAVRSTISELLPLVSSTWGVPGTPLQTQLRALAASLLDLRHLVDEAAQIVSETTDRESSLIELAVRWYQDWTRWTELADLNRGLRAPSAIPAGTTLVRYAS